MHSQPATILAPGGTRVSSHRASYQALCEFITVLRPRGDRDGGAGSLVWLMLGHFMRPLQILPGWACLVWAGLGSHCWRLSSCLLPCRVPPLQADGSTPPLIQGAQCLGRPAESLGTAPAP